MPGVVCARRDAGTSGMLVKGLGLFIFFFWRADLGGGIVPTEPGSRERRGGGRGGAGPGARSAVDTSLVSQIYTLIWFFFCLER